MNNFQYSSLLFVVFVWSLFWKSIALWRAARSEQKLWFAAMLILSTVGILEIVYLFWFAKDKLTLKEMQSWLNSATSSSKKSSR